MLAVAVNAVGTRVSSVARNKVRVRSRGGRAVRRGSELRVVCVERPGVPAVRAKLGAAVAVRCRCWVVSVSFVGVVSR